MKIGIGIGIALLCGVAVLLIFTLGSGGSSSSSSGSFAGDANRICRHLSEQEASASGFSEAALKKKVALIDDALSQLEQLDPAPNQRADYAKMLAAFRAADEYFKANIHKIGVLSYLLGQDPTNGRVHAKLLELVQPVQHHLTEAAAVAFKLGLTQCVKGFGGGPNA